MKKIIGFLAVSFLLGGQAVWAIPSAITYQGTLKDKGVPANSSPTTPYTMTFQLVDQSGATPFSNTLTKQVTVSNGLFSVPLSFQLLSPNTWESINPYLKVAVNGQELKPYEAIGATAYSVVSSAVVDGAISPAKISTGFGLVPSGTVVAFAGTSAPSGWLLCDGNAYAKSAYVSLFAAIGTTWGGDGTTFNVPDLRGRTAIGAGHGNGLTNHPLAEISGSENHTLSLNEMPSHSHSINDPGHSHPLHPLGSAGTVAVQVNGPNQGISGGGPGGGSWSMTDTVSSTTNISVNNAGGGAAFNIMPPVASINYIIKT